MAEKIGIQNLKLILLAACEGGNVADDFRADWKAGNKLAAFSRVMQLMDEVLALQGLEPKLLDDELKDLSAAERDELIKAVGDKFEIENDKAEVLVEEGFGLVVELLALADRLVKLGLNIKAAVAS